MYRNGVAFLLLVLLAGHSRAQYRRGKPLVEHRESNSICAFACRPGGWLSAPTAVCLMVSTPHRFAHDRTGDSVPCTPLSGWIVREGRVIGLDSRSSDQLAHGINVLMARNCILNLGEETLGELEKARSGIYSSFAAIGYRNAYRRGSKRGIFPDHDAAPVIAEVFEQFATPILIQRAAWQERQRYRPDSGTSRSA